MQVHQSSTSTVGIREFRSLIQDLFSTRPYILIHMRLHNQSWPDQFSQVVIFARHAILLAHMPTRTVTNIPDLEDVSAFQIDKAHAGLEPFHTYYVEYAGTEKSKGDGLLYAEHTL